MIKNRQLIFTFLLVLWSLGIRAQSHSIDSPKYLFPLIAKSNADTNKIALLNKLAAYYIFKPGNFKYDLDSAFTYLNQALQLSEKLHSGKWENETLMLKGNCYLEGEDIVHGNACFKVVTDYYQNIGNFKEEAVTWARLGECITWQHPSDKEFSFEKAYSLFGKLKKHNSRAETDALLNLADAHLAMGKLELSEFELNKALANYTAIGYKNLGYAYTLFADLYRLKGYPDKELWSTLQCIKIIKLSGQDTSGMAALYDRVGEIYQILGFTDKSIVYFKLAINQPKNNHTDIFSHSMYLRDLSNALIAKGKALTAISLIMKEFHNTSSMDGDQRAYLEEALGECYRNLRLYNKAEKYFLAMLDDFKSEVKGSYPIYLRLKCLLLCEFYVQTKQYRKARIYLNEVGTFSVGMVAANDLGRIQLVYFKIDSANGRFFSAISHYENYKKLNDSIFNIKKNQELQELEISYETVEKERSIASLQSREKVQRAELIRVNTQKNLTLIGIFLLFIIAVLAYNGFRQKRRSNLFLQAHQKEIDQKNKSLQQLNYKQQLLLIEKEWLLKEIHHRVKNNLQTTISLLNMQSAYLSNDEALAAIRNSERRMQAMSLIHQKLYQSETMTHVQMAEYVAELVSFLKESFGGSKDINFELNIQLAMLDVTQAIPLGLIINEAVTNAIKYAFPRNEKGNISISLKKDMESLFHLIVADNGVGLPTDFEINEKHNSLGLNLIRGLTDQINGEFNIMNDSGTILSITFKDSAIFKDEALKNIIEEY